jgi:hypothetical protein
MKRLLVDNLSEFLKDRMSRYQIKVRRGDIDFLANQAIEYYQALTVPCVSDMEENMKQKILYCLWGLAVDDCIDGGGNGQRLLEDTLAVFSYLFLGKKAKPQTSAGNAMNELVVRILSCETCNSDIGRSFFFLDAVDQIKGFSYERIIHERKDMATLLEYEEHSALTKDHRICFDIDLCTTQKPLSPNIIKKLRESFKFLGLALTYQGDIVTFKSEFFKEKGLNSVSILGIENFMLPPNVLDLDFPKKRKIYKNVIPRLFDEIRMQSSKYRDLAIEKLREVEEIDTSSLEQAFVHFIDKRFPGEQIERKPTNITYKNKS